MPVCKEASVVFFLEEVDFLSHAIYETKAYRELREILTHSQSIEMQEGRIDMYVLPASQAVVLEVSPKHPEENLESQARAILRHAFQEGLFDEFLTTVRIYSRLRPLFLQIIERVAREQAVWATAAALNGCANSHHGGDSHAL